ncbi:hypothetical protein BHE74_00056790 [Ensete ventricosum]|nr:hypothetical protein BHE74_00056790 [Ensete ventricosum]
MWIMGIGYNSYVLRLEGCPKDDVICGNKIGRVSVGCEKKNDKRYSRPLAFMNRYLWEIRPQGCLLVPTISSTSKPFALYTKLKLVGARALKTSGSLLGVKSHDMEVLKVHPFSTIRENDFYTYGLGSTYMII